MIRSVIIISIIVLHSPIFSQPTWVTVTSYDFSNDLTDGTISDNDLSASGGSYGNDKDGNSNSAYTFGGSDYLSKTSPANMPSGAAARRVTLWFKPTDTTQATGVLVAWGENNTNKSFGVAFGYAWGSPAWTGYGINVFGYGSDVMQFKNFYNIQDTWNFLEITTYQDTIKIYLNSTLIRTQYKVWNTTGSYPLYIGAAAWGDNFIGSIDAIRLYGDNISLPIKLTSFTGNNYGKKNILKWTSLSESNNDYYTVERSIDAVNWEHIGNIDGAGNSNMELNYEFTDDNPSSVLCYYRLKQTDFDGKYEYTNIIHITQEEDNWLNFSVYPNPSKGTINLSYDGNKEKIKSVEIYNAMGEMVYQTNSYESTINFLNYLNGTYFVKIKTSSKELTERINLQN